MKKKKYILFLLIATTTLSLSGCGIKFIEKVEPSTEESTSNLGGIIIDKTTSASTESSKSDESPTDNTLSQEPDTTIPEESSENATEPESITGIFKHSGITFIADDSLPTMYCMEECPVKSSPSIAARDLMVLKKGDFVTVQAVSEDNRWAQVSVYGGAASFMLYEYLTFEEVSPDNPLNPLETTTQETTPSETVPPETIPPQTTVPIQTEPPQTEPPTTTSSYTRIPYPSNASSTSFNMGVEFADVILTLTILEDIQVGDGPDYVSGSSGYNVITTLRKGDTIKCTGIGRNGFVRVEVNGQIGFFDSQYARY